MCAGRGYVLRLRKRVVRVVDSWCRRRAMEGAIRWMQGRGMGEDRGGGVEMRVRTGIFVAQLGGEGGWRVLPMGLSVGRMAARTGGRRGADCAEICGTNRIFSSVDPVSIVRKYQAPVHAVRLAPMEADPSPLILCQPILRQPVRHATYTGSKAPSGCKACPWCKALAPRAHVHKHCQLSLADSAWRTAGSGACVRACPG